MPRVKSKKTTKKSYKSKSKSKSYKKSKTFLPMVTFGRGFPMKAKSTHRFCESFTLTMSVGVPTIYRWSCNGMFKPNITGSSSLQPLYFDQFVVIYNHFCVIGSKMNITATTGSAVPVYMSMIVDDDTTLTATASPEAFAEQNSGKKPRYLSTAIEPQTFVQPWSAKKTFGGSVLSNSNLRGNNSTNPAEQSYFTIIAQPADKISNSTVFLMVEIEYTAIWTELRDVARS